MPDSRIFSTSTTPRDLTSGAVVFFVALPLCLGVALASEAPLISGVIAGVIGGIVVGILSGSHTSVSGPAAGLTAIVAAQVTTLGSFDIFLLAVVIAGLIQIGLGIARAGFLAEFVPSAVIKGLLAAIGVIIVLKQIPHLLGRDTDPEGDMAFIQPDQENTFTELVQTVFNIHLGAAVIGLASVALLVLWTKVRVLKRLPIPSPLVVVLSGVGLKMLFDTLGAPWAIDATHLVEVPVADSLAGLTGFLTFPDFTQWTNPAVYTAGVTIALVASLETLLNLEAVDKIDPKQRNSPPSRELWAQGIGNVVSGLIGGLPVTSVIVRSSVNINAGCCTKLSAITHGMLLLFSVVLLPTYLNLIPLSCLAAILIVTGMKLASPGLIKQMWKDGRYQFTPFAVTVVAIVLTDLLAGILIGLAVSVGFILNSNLRRPIRRFNERHLGGNVLHIELANQVSFLNRAALAKTLDGIPKGGRVLIDAQSTDYIDPDVLDLIRHYMSATAPARGVQVSLSGFRKKYRLEDSIQYVDYSTRELQDMLTPAQVLQILKDGHTRFRTGKRLTRDLGRLVHATGQGQHPLAVILSCIDSRSPAELIFDCGVGDIFAVRIAGNTLSPKVLGSMEFGCAVAGAKLILVLGHTRCGAVSTAVRATYTQESMNETTGCGNIESILKDIQDVIDPEECRREMRGANEEQERYIDDVACANVRRTMDAIQQQSAALRKLVAEGRLAVVGAMYDVVGGDMSFFVNDSPGM